MQEWVSIGKMSMFIDFFNYYPFMLSKIKSKNEPSENILLFMGKHQHVKSNSFVREEEVTEVQNKKDLLNILG